MLKKLHDAGIKPSLINGMAMEFGQNSGEDLFEATKSAANGMHKHISEIYTEWSEQEVWQHIRICPNFDLNIHLNNSLIQN